MIHLYDTARGAVVPFEPGELVTLYSCGITPYDSAHLGHAQVYLTSVSYTHLTLPTILRV